MPMKTKSELSQNLVNNFVNAANLVKSAISILKENNVANFNDVAELEVVDKFINDFNQNELKVFSEKAVTIEDDIKYYHDLLAGLTDDLALNSRYTKLKTKWLGSFNHEAITNSEALVVLNTRMIKLKFKINGSIGSKKTKLIKVYKPLKKQINKLKAKMSNQEDEPLVMTTLYEAIAICREIESATQQGRRISNALELTKNVLSIVKANAGNA